MIEMFSCNHNVKDPVVGNMTFWILKSVQSNIQCICLICDSAEQYENTKIRIYASSKIKFILF